MDSLDSGWSHSIQVFDSDRALPHLADTKLLRSFGNSPPAGQPRTAHRRIRNQRASFHHEVSRWLVQRYGLIAVEDLNIRGLSRGRLARSVHDVGWNSFFAKLSYKAASAGRVLVQVDPRGTSQRCVCGVSVPKTLADRWHECPACGLSAARDVVSAQVILQSARIGRSRRNVEDVVSCVPREALAFQATE